MADANEIKTVEQLQELVYQAQNDKECLELEEYFHGEYRDAFYVVKPGSLGIYYALVMTALAYKQKGVTFKVRKEG